MDVLSKARVLGKAGSFDSCGPKMCEVNVGKGLGGVYYAKAENKNCKIFKTLMSNSCSFDCRYCANSCSKEKVSYAPAELAKVFGHLHKKLDVNGLFLSSGVGSDVDSMSASMLEAVKMLRFDYKFKGYVHFKALPGVSYDIIKEASKLSDRMSINLEAPNNGVLKELSSCKDYKVDILRRQAWISRFNLKSGQTTQMIINEMSSDKDVLRMMDWEYDNLNLRRIYFSAFFPVAGTKMENLEAESPLREARLYNVDFLRRDYGFRLKEFDPIMEDGRLPLNEDPKLALAKLDFNRVDINEASYEELIRVPGIGPLTASKIVAGARVLKYEDLHKLGGWVERAKPFIEVNGMRQSMLGEF